MIHITTSGYVFSVLYRTKKIEFDCLSNEFFVKIEYKENEKRPYRSCIVCLKNNYGVEQYVAI